MRNKKRAWTVLSVVVATFGFLLMGKSFAGFIAMPLKAELDIANVVVVGKITDMAKVQDARVQEAYEGKLVYGKATIAVSEPLKGTTTKEITMAVAMHVDRDASKFMQSPPHAYHKGDEGIFVIVRGDTPSHGYGLLSKDRLKEVKAALEELDKRTWSEEVNGLKAWASADMERPSPGWAGTVMFTVKNVSTKPILLPRSSYQGVVTAIAKNSEGKETELPGFYQRLPVKPPLVSPDALKPGETRYLHPDGENHGFFVIPKELPPGKYTISVWLNNAVKDGDLGKLWTGKIVAPTFTIEVPEKSAASQPTGK